MCLIALWLVRTCCVSDNKNVSMRVSCWTANTVIEAVWPSRNFCTIPGLISNVCKALLAYCASQLWGYCVGAQILTITVTCFVVDARFCTACLACTHRCGGRPTTLPAATPHYMVTSYPVPVSISKFRMEICTGYRAPPHYKVAFYSVPVSISKFKIEMCSWHNATPQGVVRLLHCREIVNNVIGTHNHAVRCLLMLHKWSYAVEMTVVCLYL